jgi:preprotein translocase subunit SecD
MFKTVKGRLITIVLMVLMAGWQLKTKGLKQGLDLQGGMHLVLEVDDPDGTLTDDARQAAIEQAERIIRTRIDEFGVEEPLVQLQGTERIIVELEGITDERAARDIIQRAAFLEWKLVLPVQDVERALPRIDRVIVATLGEERLREMIDRNMEVAAPTSELEEALFGGASTDTVPPDSTAAGDPTAADTSALADLEAETVLRPLTSMLNSGDLEGTFLVAVSDLEVVEQLLAMPEVQSAMPREVALHWGQDPVGAGAQLYRRLFVLTRDAFLSGSELEDASAGRDPQFNQAQVQFQLSRAGGRMFSRLTSQHVGDYLAILLDNEVMSAPVIRDRIGATGQIEMPGSPLEEARNLALVLRAGALPVPLRIEEERTVGPSLGQDSIDRGRIAGIVGIVAVVLIMVLYYRMAGILAILALGVYVILVLGGLAGMNATLTLPGIAGLILSVGMAVDANVLIFERIREELAAGRATRTAVDEGFAHALSAIVDANITTLITALILFQFGTGPIKGFAVTLSIGIVASFVSALYVTRSFFLLYLQGKKASDPISI